MCIFPLEYISVADCIVTFTMHTLASLNVQKSYEFLFDIFAGMPKEVCYKRHIWCTGSNLSWVQITSYTEAAFLMHNYFQLLVVSSIALIGSGALKSIWNRKQSKDDARGRLVLLNQADGIAHHVWVFWNGQSSLALLCKLSHQPCNFQCIDGVLSSWSLTKTAWKKQDSRRAEQSSHAL